MSDLASAATALTNLGITATATEVNYTDVTTLGTVQASKAVTADSSGNVKFPDNEELRFGTGDDANIKHDASNTKFLHTGTGGLYIGANTLGLQNGAATESYFTATENGSAIMYYDNSNKLETSSTGVNITGTAVTDGVTVDGPLDIEEVKERVSAATSTTGTINFNMAEQAIQNYTADQTANRTINFRGDSSTTLNNTMDTGQSMTCTIIMKQGSTAYYLNAYQIDGSTITPKWSGGSAPSAGNASSLDVYTFTIIKTADATFTVLASQTQYA